MYSFTFTTSVVRWDDATVWNIKSWNHTDSIWTFKIPAHIHGSRLNTVYPNVLHFPTDWNEIFGLNIQTIQQTTLLNLFVILMPVNHYINFVTKPKLATITLICYCFHIWDVWCIKFALKSWFECCIVYCDRFLAKALKARTHGKKFVHSSVTFAKHKTCHSDPACV